ncbi:MAG: vitamin B12-dependent ribonucleotide reductase [Microthrixaceae bacterium]|nr:vitamin B12-dependent ribonucleotide reductase [Microthrixaceae bacterium]
MSVTDDHVRVGVRRYFTLPGVHPYDELSWERRDALLIDHRDGSYAFEQRGVEFPSNWSTNASNIVAQKYFRGRLGSPDRESSLRQLIDRVVGTITDWGITGDYFADDDEAAVFRAELTWLLVHQRLAFNSPVWFNIGVPGAPKQASACFILSVEDSMESILEWYRQEGVIFKGGSGSGVNLSKIRSSREFLKGGGEPSGPVSFMRGADASAGTIKSGGKTRRAAKMVMLDVDHPDVDEFIWCKAREERKARALRDAGFDMGLDGADSHSIQYQNANNSVRLSDAFMQAVVDDRDWELRAITTGEVVETRRAREIFSDIALAAWECADPGVQFDTTINRWHTLAATAPINGSNPCSEYMSIDDSACNLASINLLPFLDDDGEFEVEAFRHAVEISILAQEILVGNADYPTPAIAANTLRFRQLGLGYTNLGAMLMALGVGYDSDAGRAWAATLTATMTGHAYLTSARLASRMGPYDGYAENREHQLRVLDMHRDALCGITESLVPASLTAAAHDAWDEACRSAAEVGVRNSQATVLAPTGTISFLLDCDTTGIEPDLGLVKTKRLVGGGSMQIVNQTVPRALRRLGYDEEQIAEIVEWIADRHSVLGAPHLDPAHIEVFACSMGEVTIDPLGHVRMMAAAQPFLSGAISKTANVSETTTPEQIEDLLLEAWRLGLKALAIYRDNCKLGQPLSTGTEDSDSGSVLQAAEVEVVPAPATPIRERLPRSRRSQTFEFRVADCKGFVTVGEYDDGRPGELFIRVSKQGSTLAGIMDAFAISVSHGLQYGVPLRGFVEAFVGMRFEPAGMTDDPEVRIATSLIDYLFRRLAIEYLGVEERHQLGIFSVSERLQPTLPGVEEAVVSSRTGHDVAVDPPSGPRLEAATRVATAPDAPLCMQCGVRMQRAGSCYSCAECGATSGCS